MTSTPPELPNDDDARQKFNEIIEISVILTFRLLISPQLLAGVFKTFRVLLLLLFFLAKKREILL